MRVIAFAASLSAIDEDAGGVTAKGFPMTSCYVENFPAQITHPHVWQRFAFRTVTNRPWTPG